MGAAAARYLSFLKIRKTGGDRQEKSACKLVAAKKHAFCLIRKRKAVMLEISRTFFKIFVGFENPTYR
jgi:hypothetical protein